MKGFLIGWLSRWLERQALFHNRFVGWYRRFCEPDGERWAEYLRRHGGLQGIGRSCSIQTDVVLQSPAHLRLGDNVRLAGCTMLGKDESAAMLREAYGIELDACADIDVRDNVFIGHQAIVAPGVTIGPNAIIAAQALVAESVPEDSIVAGVPARVVGRLSDHVRDLQERTRSLPWYPLLLEKAGTLGPASQALIDARRSMLFDEDAPA